MKDKLLICSGIVALIALSLILTSCTEKTKAVPKQVTAPQHAGVLTDYGVPQIKKLADKLRHSDTELTHIMVIGDSHTAADFLSGQLRKQLQSQFGNGGIGFISPLAVPGNRYSNVKFSKAGGWQLENSRREKNPGFTLGGNIAVPLSGKSEVRISAVDGEPELRAQALYRSRGETTLNVQAQSHSLADSGWQWAMSAPVIVPASFAVSMTDGGDAQLGGFWLTNLQPHGVIVSALGINGAQVSMLDKWEANWPGVLKKLEPDLIILAYGTNEAFNTDLPLNHYQQMLTRQIKKIRQSVPDATILLVGPGSSIMNKKGVGCRQRQPELLKPIIAVQKQVAQVENVLFWDWFAFMGGDCSIERWAVEGKARPDLIHLSAEGYQDSAAALWQDLAERLNL
ncbi:SGNH/GDSL hydrolase family protein [Yersinia pekkanenii]|uniref:GDSL-like Lipase/Acylhydrolase n=1 Tax=Yersinia pekkanenii TaxID=1288385 RepID=A0A0T9PMU5_9GAMM|nr:SGNH/GDSL hydrolase family protein [Yersinia pekkanenii]CNH73476.1 GDSL-like Lipase/Acylhydrolase [Yersinia pekkanenii]CRY68042.1 GDSL-like Lipase/Acylhydrolase [Yersinia pekkanenii]